MSPRALPAVSLLVAALVAAAACDRADGGIDLDLLLADAGSPGDGGPADAGEESDAGDGRPGCDPPASEALVDPRRAATACVVDRWLAELPGLPAAEQYRRVKAAVDDTSLASTFPLRTGTRVVFVAEILAGEVPFVAGEFNSWSPEAGPMQPLAQSGFAYREELLDVRTHAYRFVYGLGTPEISWVEDPAARWLSPVGFVDEFNSLAVVGAPELGTGLLRHVPRFASASLAATRDLYLWLPASVLDGGAAIDAVYALDGREMVAKGRADLALEERVEAGGPSLLGVFVDVPATARRDDYTFGTATARGDRTAAFLATELVPWVDAKFPTRRAAAARAVTGASLGGLQALYTAWNHPAVFGLVGSQSGSFFWPEPDREALTHEIEAASPRPLRIYLDNGLPNDNETWNRHLAAVLDDQGYDYVHREFQGARHDWLDWGGRWPGMLAWLYPSD